MRATFSVLCLGFILCLSPVQAQNNTLLTPDKEQKLGKFSKKVQDLARRTKDLRSKITEINDRIFKGKFSAAPPRLKIVHGNMKTSAFQIEEIEYILNRKVIYTGRKGQSKWLSSKSVIFQGKMPTANHELKVRVKVRGRSYLVFKYMEKNVLLVSNFFRFQTAKGKEIIIKVQLIDNGNKNLKKRLSLRFQKSV